MTIVQWYKRKKEDNRLVKEAEKKKKKEAEFKAEEEKQLNKIYQDALDNIMLYPGSIKEYEEFKGYEPGSIITCETGSTEQDILIRKNISGHRYINNNDIQLRNKLIDDSLEAIVHSSPFYYPNDPYLAYSGLPVKKAE